jgi:hypothetical protein
MKRPSLIYKDPTVYPLSNESKEINVNGLLVFCQANQKCPEHLTYAPGTQVSEKCLDITRKVVQKLKLRFCLLFAFIDLLSVNQLLELAKTYFCYICYWDS